MSILIDFFTIVFFLLSISATATNLLPFIALGLITLLIINSKGRVVFNTLMKWMLFFLIAVGVEIMLSGNFPVKYMLSRFTFFVPIILTMYYRKRENSNKILSIVLVIWGLVSIWAIYLMNTGIMNARSVVMRLQTSIPFSGGGYPLAIGSAILTVFIFDLLVWGKIRKVISIPLVVVLCISVFLTQSTTTIVAMVVGMIFSGVLRLTSVSKLRNLSKQEMVSVFFAVVICLLFVLLRGQIGDTIISFAYGKSDILSRRIVEFGSILSSNSDINIDTSDSEGRFTRLISSINMFFKHPIFGVTRITGTDHYAQSAYGVGSHGELFDSLARFGIFAGIPYLALFFGGLIYPRKKQEFNSGFGYVITFLILFIFNPCLYMTVNIVLFFIIPLMIDILNRKMGEEENANICITSNISK